MHGGHSGRTLTLGIRAGLVRKAPIPSSRVSCVAARAVAAQAPPAAVAETKNAYGVFRLSYDTQNVSALSLHLSLSPY